MSEPTVTTPPATSTSKTPHKARGRNDQPPRQYYHAGRGAARKIKKATEQYRAMTGKGRLTPEERSALAFFTFPISRENGES